VCGIAGILGSFKGRSAHLAKMLEKIAHRGPDEKGEYIDENYAGGMQRLSINDIEGGSQPFFNHDKSIILFYNGEIYNSVKLRQYLRKKGKKFRTKSDGEVIVHLYELKGTDCFRDLDGMYAISIWDSKRQKLILARDIAGEKPLYYSRQSGGLFAYASEVKSLKSLPWLSVTLNHQAIWDFPTFLWIPEPATIYNEIESVPRGHCITLDCDNLDISPIQNDFDPVQGVSLDDDSAIELTRLTVENAVKSRLLSDVPIGSFLSGGLDSSIISTIAARELPTLDTFTVSFGDIVDPYHGHADESKAAAETAKLIGSNHHTIRVTADSLRSSLDDFCKFGDLPFAVSSGLGVLAVSKAAHDMGIKVLLTGDGADECFGGYSWYSHLSSISESNYETPKKPVSFQNFGMPLEDRIALLEKADPRYRAWGWHYYAAESEKNKLFSPNFMNNVKTSLRLFNELEESSDPVDYIRHDRNFYFPNEMLRKVDRMTMAFSVEGRAPFASPSILALSEQLSMRHMIKDRDLKWVLRRAFEDILPMDVINRPKHGFNVPIDFWLNGEWSDLVDEAFGLDSNLHKLGIISKDSLSVAKKMLSDTERLNGHTIFCYIMLNKWLEVN
jgi:asparagine synthase (glutamine-hydrolysing)